MKYVDAFDIAKRVIETRKSIKGYEYPQGTARDAAMSVVGLPDNELVNALSAFFSSIEEPMRIRATTRNAWDGSIA